MALHSPPILTASSPSLTMPHPSRPPFFILTGCSGGGKSTLLDALSARGHATIPEPGRRIVTAQTDPASPRLPWNDPACFARTAIDMAIADYRSAAAHPGPVFFDRGLIDALAALAHATGTAVDHATAAAHPHAPVAFLAPPWPGIHVTDSARRHGFDAALEEYDRLRDIYPRLGYRLVPLPLTDVHSRAEFVLSTISPLPES